MTTTPYLEGSSTWVTRMVPSAPVFLWKASISFSGNSQMTSLQTHTPSVSFPTSPANADLHKLLLLSGAPLLTAALLSPGAYKARAGAVRGMICAWHFIPSGFAAQARGVLFTGIEGMMQQWGQNSEEGAMPVEHKEGVARAVIEDLIGQRQGACSAHGLLFL